MKHCKLASMVYDKKVLPFNFSFAYDLESGPPWVSHHIDKNGASENGMCGAVYLDTAGEQYYQQK
jgi:hypothetical protein